MAPPKPVSLAQGFAYVALSLWVGSVCQAFVPNLWQCLMAPPTAVDEPVCMRPVAVETPLGLRLDCADAQAWVGCAPEALDRISVGAQGCRRVPGGMPMAWRVPLGHKLDLNRADVAALTALPDIGAKTACAIVAHRLAHGAFTSVASLEAVRGVGPKRAAHLAAFVTVASSG